MGCKYPLPVPSIFSVDQEVRLSAKIEDEVDGAGGLRKKDKYEIFFKESEKASIENGLKKNLVLVKASTQFIFTQYITHTVPNAASNLKNWLIFPGQSKIYQYFSMKIAHSLVRICITGSIKEQTLRSLQEFKFTRSEVDTIICIFNNRSQVILTKVILQSHLEVPQYLRQKLNVFAWHQSFFLLLPLSQSGFSRETKPIGYLLLFLFLSRQIQIQLDRYRYVGVQIYMIYNQQSRLIYQSLSLSLD